jgi:thiol-disulfide isomerase/thioredoxin
MALAAAGAASLGSPSIAVPRSIEAFGPDTWGAWQTSLPRPAIVVFTTTYCPTCPEAFAYLAKANQIHKLGATLIAVVMDGEGQPHLLRNAHYGHADRLFVFSGPETALRYGVDPRWRGVTPYVALFGAKAAPTLVAGRPSLEQLQRGLRLP